LVIKAITLGVTPTIKLDEGQISHLGLFWLCDG